MADHPSRHDAHLLVAAIRVLEHRNQHPPDEQELADLLQWHPDRARVIALGLADAGITAVLKSPFETRFKVGDHTRIEDLDDQGAGQGIAREMEAYEERSRAEQENIERMFGTMPGRERPQGDATAGLQDEFGDFKQRKPKNPFGDD